MDFKVDGRLHNPVTLQQDDVGDEQRQILILLQDDGWRSECMIGDNMLGQGGAGEAPQRTSS
ncbi:MAG: hypothetical protein IPK19_24520 [Chloroflexi bacterium]|nr:hypothetical protein [Chloroflexota bacterium]